MEHLRELFVHSQGGNGEFVVVDGNVLDVPETLQIYRSGMWGRVLVVVSVVVYPDHYP